MKLEVADPQNVVDQEDIDKLTRIVYSVADGWHEWAAPDPREAGMSAYLAQRPSDRELLEKSYVQATAYPDDVPRKVVRIHVAPPGRLHEVDGNEPLDLSLGDAVKYVKQPLKILVENVINDGKFLRKYLKAVDSDLVDLLEDHDPPVVFDHSGGKAEMLNHLKDRLDSVAQHRVPLRLLVIFDSDACYPTHVTSETNSIKQACETAGLNYHCFEKRSIENYIVDRELDEYSRQFPDLAGAIEFFRGLSRTQKDFYPIKKGFPKNSGMTGQVALYADVSAEDGAHKISRAADYIINMSKLDLELSDLEEISALQEFETIVKTIRMEL